MRIRFGLATGDAARPVFVAGAKGQVTGVEAIIVRPPDFNTAVGVEVATPLRLERKGRLITPRNFRPGDLFSGLVRRVSGLMASEAGIRLTADFVDLKNKWSALGISNARLCWRNCYRWSSAQRKEIPTGGIVGRFETDLSHAPELFDYLWLGQWLNVGKGAVMGNGSLRLHPV